jgi:4a-hydroxytetrahydrobiopterin dehydratase
VAAPGRSKQPEGEAEMTDAKLRQKTCTPCRGGIPPLTPEAVADLSPQAPDWEAIDGATKLKRGFKFRDFKQALAFVDRVGAAAEAEFHHPASIAFGWGFAVVELQTKKIKGLHENDFILAAKIDEIARDLAGA